MQLNAIETAKKEAADKVQIMERRCSTVEDENRRLREENDRLRDELRFLRSEVSTCAGISMAQAAVVENFQGCHRLQDCGWAHVPVSQPQHA